MTGTALLATGGVAFGVDGGIETPEPPQLRDAVCIESCAGLREVAVGGKVALEGRNLAGVTEVRFAAREGARVPIEPNRVSDDRVIAKVPQGADDGPPRVSDSYGQSSDSPEEIRIISEDQVEPGDSFELRQADVKRPKAFYAGPRASVQFLFAAEKPQDVRVDVIRRRSGSIVRSIVEKDAEPFRPITKDWNGTVRGGRVARNGDYKFAIGPASSGARDDRGTKFAEYDHKFPIRARHSYGDGIGAPRSGHTHQGQDVFSRCGAKLVAARGGRVQTKAYHSSAGYYLVIDGKKTKVDYVYMHMKGPSRFREGQRVKTGERIGEVGESGNASGCHLHFELWGGPGWYEGGSFLRTVTRQLKKWDRWS